MKTPKPGRLPPPLPWDAERAKPPAVPMTERARFAQMSCMDYDRRFGDHGKFSGPARTNASVPYISLVLPEIILKAGSLAELESWDKTCKSLIADFVDWKLGRHSDYVFGILAPLIRKIKTLQELKTWDGLAKVLVFDFKMKGLELSWCYVLSVLPELLDRSKDAAELNAWDAKIKTMFASISSDKENYLRRLIPKMLNRAANPEELEARATSFSG